jgi:hypothetical protein
MTRCSSGPISPKTTTTVSGTLASDRRQARDSEAVGRHLALRVGRGREVLGICSRAADCGCPVGSMRQHAEAFHVE